MLRLALLLQESVLVPEGPFVYATIHVPSCTICALIEPPLGPRRYCIASWSGLGELGSTRE